MSELFYPSIDLFIYDLKYGLNSSDDEIQKNLINFRSKLPKNIDFNDIEKEAEYLELIPSKFIKMKSQNNNLEGYYLPVRLNDVYGLQIDCSINNRTDPQLIRSFSQIKTEIEQDLTPNSLGQTWLVSGWLTDTFHQDSEEIAKECYQTLFPQTNWQTDLFSQGTFLKAKFFELVQANSDFNNHTIIILYPNEEIARKAANFYSDWMGLFCYYHKITWAYNQSRVIKEALAKHYQKVDDYIKSIKNFQKDKKNLLSLQKPFNLIQDILNLYTIDLLNLAFQKEIIEINLVNYKTRLEIIKQKAGEESDLNCLEKFSNKVEKKYLEQINKDSENMQLGLKLLENNINALRSRIEIEKAERDRIFQNLITIIGTGVAGAGLVDSNNKKCTVIFPQDSWICKTPILNGIIVPIILIIIFGLIGWLVRQWLKRS